MKKYDNKVNYLSVGVRTKRKMFQADVGVPANIERAYHKAIGEDANGCRSPHQRKNGVLYFRFVRTRTVEKIKIFDLNTLLYMGLPVVSY